MNMAFDVSLLVVTQPERGSEPITIEKETLQQVVERLLNEDQLAGRPAEGVCEFVPEAQRNAWPEPGPEKILKPSTLLVANKVGIKNPLTKCRQVIVCHLSPAGLGTLAFRPCLDWRGRRQPEFTAAVR